MWYNPQKTMSNSVITPRVSKVMEWFYALVTLKVHILHEKQVLVNSKKFHVGLNLAHNHDSKKDFIYIMVDSIFIQYQCTKYDIVNNENLGWQLVTDR